MRDERWLKEEKFKEGEGEEGISKETEEGERDFHASCARWDMVIFTHHFFFDYALMNSTDLRIIPTQRKSKKRWRNTELWKSRRELETRSTFLSERSLFGTGQKWVPQEQRSGTKLPS